MYGATRTTPYFSMEQHRQHPTSLWSNTDNTILLYGATRTTPYFYIEQHGQHHTYVWSNTDNTILLYGATRTTPYFSIEQHRQHHTYVWSNTDNTILMYGATRATPYFPMTTQEHHTYILQHRQHHTSLLLHRCYTIIASGYMSQGKNTSPPTTLLNTITMVKLSHPPFKVYSLSDHNQIIIIVQINVDTVSINIIITIDVRAGLDVRQAWAWVLCACTVCVNACVHSNTYTCSVCLLGWRIITDGQEETRGRGGPVQQYQMKSGLSLSCLHWFILPLRSKNSLESGCCTVLR